MAKQIPWMYCVEMNNFPNFMKNQQMKKVFSVKLLVVRSQLYQKWVLPKEAFF